MEAQSIKTEDVGQRHGLLASREQNAEFDAQYRSAWFRTNRWNFLIVFLILGILIPLIIGSVARHHPYAQNIPNTPAHQGQAYVASKTAFSTNTKDPVTYYVATFRLNGKLIKASTFNRVKWNQTPTETTVPVTYHIGKNGEVLISDWQVPPAK